MAPQVFHDVLSMLGDDGVLVEEGNLVRSPGHLPHASEAQQVAIDEYLRLLDSDPFSPPTDAPLDPELLNLLAGENRVVRVSDSVVFSTPAYEEMLERIRSTPCLWVTCKATDSLLSAVRRSTRSMNGASP